jgi:VWFA-related protein
MRYGLTGRILLGITAVVSASGQSQPAGKIASDAPEFSVQQDEPARFRAGVNLVPVPVIARDRDGRIVGSLRKEDFRLFDKGKPQVITRFDVENRDHPVVAIVDSVSPGNSPVAAPPKPAVTLPDRFITLLFDDVHLPFDDLARSRTAAQSQLSAMLTPTTRVAVFTTSGITKQDFTNDRELLKKAIDHIVPWRNPAQPDDDCVHMSYYQADRIVNFNDGTALTVAAMEYAACHPADANDAGREALIMARNIVSGNDHEFQVTFGALQDAVRRLSATAGSRSVALLSPGFEFSNTYRDREDTLINQAIKANVTINAIDARGLFARPPGGDASRPIPGVPGNVLALQIQYESISDIAKGDLMSELADGTGGQVFRHSNALGDGFEKLTKQPEAIYILGFSPSDLKYDGSFHSLKVVVQNPPGLDLQVRRGYYAPRHATDPNEAALEELREALLTRGEQRDIPVDLNLQFFKSTPVNAKLSVIARVDLRPLHFRKEGDRNVDTLKMVAGVFDSNGMFVNAIESTVSMKLFDQTLAKLPASGISVKSNFDLMPGDYSIRLVVRDGNGQLMTTRNGAIRIQ